MKDKPKTYGDSRPPLNQSQHESLIHQNKSLNGTNPKIQLSTYMNESKKRSGAKKNIDETIHEENYEESA